MIRHFHNSVYFVINGMEEYGVIN